MSGNSSAGGCSDPVWPQERARLFRYSIHTKLNSKYDLCQQTVCIYMGRLKGHAVLIHPHCVICSRWRFALPRFGETTCLWTGAAANMCCAAAPTINNTSQPFLCVCVSKLGCADCHENPLYKDQNNLIKL